MTSWGYPRYSVYRVADPTKRVMHDTVIPVFQKSTGGAYSGIVPGAIWYAPGYIIFNTPLDVTYILRVHTGDYLTPSLLAGCINRSFNDKTTTQEKTCYGDTTIRRQPTIDDWDSKLDVLHCKVQAELLTSGGNANSHVHLYHRPGGVAGNGVTYTVINPGAPGSIAVSVVGSAIQVTSAYAIGAMTSTANDVIAALNANTAVQALGVVAVRPPTETGLGIVAALGITDLAGGVDLPDFTALKGAPIVVLFYDNYSAGNMWAGYGLVGQLDWSGSPKDLVKASLSISGTDESMHRVKETFGLYGMDTPTPTPTPIPAPTNPGNEVLMLPETEPTPFIPNPGPVIEPSSLKARDQENEDNLPL